MCEFNMVAEQVAQGKAFKLKLINEQRQNEFFWVAFKRMFHMPPQTCQKISKINSSIAYNEL
jgi:hypothetical protein